MLSKMRLTFKTITNSYQCQFHLMPTWGRIIRQLAQDCEDEEIFNAAFNFNFEKEMFCLYKIGRTTMLSQSFQNVLIQVERL